MKEPRRRWRTPATFTLLALILVAFGIEWLDPKRVLNFAALIPAAVKDGQYWRLVTSMFLHGGVPHLLLNGVGLFQLGRFYERMFGTRRFLVVYFVTGITASLASTFYNPGWSVGASGAILGVLGAFIFSIRRSPRWRNHPLGRSLVEQGIFWIIANLLFTWKADEIVHLPAEIDKAGHVGGLVSGLILGAILPQPAAPPPPPAQAVIDVRPQPYDE